MIVLCKCGGWLDTYQLSFGFVYQTLYIYESDMSRVSFANSFGAEIAAALIMYGPAALARVCLGYPSEVDAERTRCFAGGLPLERPLTNVRSMLRPMWAACVAGWRCSRKLAIDFSVSCACCCCCRLVALAIIVHFTLLCLTPASCRVSSVSLFSWSCYLLLKTQEKMVALWHAFPLYMLLCGLQSGSTPAWSFL